MLKQDGPAPYAPVKTLMSVVDRHRQVRLQTFDLATLGKIGVPDSLAPRTLQALRLLGLIDENGAPTSEFEALRLAPSDAFEAKLADVVREVYSPIFSHVDPTSATVEQIEDAFRGFTPAGQRARMVTLFTGLLTESGILPDVVRKKSGPKPKPAYRVTPSKPKKASTEVFGPKVDVVQPVVATSDAEGDTYQVPLRSGGSVSVAMDVNLFTLSVEDRSFVMDLVDRLTSYAKASSGGDGLTI